MKKILSLLLMLFMSIGMFAETITTTIVSQSGSGSVLTWSNENATFSFTTNPGGVQVEQDRGLQMGAGKGTFVLTSNQTFTDVTAVEILASTNNIENKISVSVGETDFGEQSLPKQNNATYTFQNETSSGNIVITINDKVKTVWIKTITIICSGSTPPPPPQPNICEKVSDFKNLETGKSFTFDGDLICVQNCYVNDNRYLYVTDETGGMVIYNPSGDNVEDYTTCDIIPGGWTATKTVYKNLPEATGAIGFAPSTETENIEPIEITIDGITADMYGDWVIIKNVLIRKKVTGTKDTEGPSIQLGSYYITDGGDPENKLDIFAGHTNDFNLPTDWETERYDVVGILGAYNTAQIYPTGIEKNNETVTDNIDIIESSIKKVAYYNMQGIESSKPFDGLNIVVTEYENGTKKTNKQIYKF